MPLTVADLAQVLLYLPDVPILTMTLPSLNETSPWFSSASSPDPDPSSTLIQVLNNPRVGDLTHPNTIRELKRQLGSNQADATVSLIIDPKGIYFR